MLIFDVEDEDWEATAEAAEAEKDGEVAEIFDKKLVNEVSRIGTLSALANKRLEANTLKGDLEVAQYANAMLSLPSDHPASVGYMSNVFASLSRR